VPSAEEFVALVRRMGGAAGRASGQALLARYAEPHRHYHTVTHLVAVLSTVDVLAPEAAEADIARLAGWYHDAVYDPSRGDNEECSALLAEDELAQMALPRRYVERVAELVRITAAHHPPAGDAEAAVLCDADLAVLAAYDWSSGLLDDVRSRNRALLHLNTAILAGESPYSPF